jgi:hypothetical protein
MTKARAACASPRFFELRVGDLCASGGFVRAGVAYVDRDGAVCHRAGQSRSTLPSRANPRHHRVAPARLPVPGTAQLHSIAASIVLARHQAITSFIRSTDKLGDLDKVSDPLLPRNGVQASGLFISVCRILIRGHEANRLYRSQSPQTFPSPYQPPWIRSTRSPVIRLHTSPRSEAEAEVPRVADRPGAMPCTPVRTPYAACSPNEVNALATATPILPDSTRPTRATQYQRSQKPSRSEPREFPIFRREVPARRRRRGPA